MPATIINLTPLPLRICNAEGAILRVLEPAPEGPASVIDHVDRMAQIGTIDGIALYAHRVHNPVGIPAPKQDTYYVVYPLVAKAAPGHTGLLIPGPVVKDSRGIPVGYLGLVSP
jgi:hypothetical protein